MFNTYGRIGNGELLRRYGCVASPNPHDEALLRVTSDEILAIARQRMPEHRGVGNLLIHALSLISEVSDDRM